MSAPRKLYTGQPSQSSVTSCYAAGVNSRVEITAATATNTSASSTKHFTIWLVPSGSQASTNIAIKQRTLEALKSNPCWEIVGQVIEPSAMIKAQQQTAAKITLHISGVVSPVRP